MTETYSMQKSNCAHQMMINVTIREQEDENNWKLIWQFEVNGTGNDPQESMHSSYEEASEKALQLIAAASPKSVSFDRIRWRYLNANQRNAIKH